MLLSQIEHYLSSLPRPNIKFVREESVSPAKSMVRRSKPQLKRSINDVFAPPMDPAQAAITPSIPQDEEEITGLEDSGIFPLPPAFDLQAFYEKYVIRKGDIVQAKTVGVAVPVELHKRMTTYLEKTKDDPKAPKSLKELTLMCLGQTLDYLEEKQANL